MNKNQSKMDAKENIELDPKVVEFEKLTKNLNKLCRLTPEGYMIIIEQRQFEGREGYHPMPANDLNKSWIGNKSVQHSEMTGVTGIAGQSYLKNVLSRDVEKIFSRVCQSIELYKTDNIPIITEFLEFWLNSHKEK